MTTSTLLFLNSEPLFRFLLEWYFSFFGAIAFILVLTYKPGLLILLKVPFWINFAKPVCLFYDFNMSGAPKVQIQKALH